MKTQIVGSSGCAIVSLSGSLLSTVKKCTRGVAKMQTFGPTQKSSTSGHRVIRKGFLGASKTRHFCNTWRGFLQCCVDRTDAPLPLGQGRTQKTNKLTRQPSPAPVRHLCTHVRCALSIGAIIMVHPHTNCGLSIGTLTLPPLTSNTATQKYIHSTAVQPEPPQD